MRQNRTHILALCLALLLLLGLLSGCGHTGGRDDAQADASGVPSGMAPELPEELSSDLKSLTRALAPGETALLDRLPQLKTADLSGSADPREVMLWAQAHPGVYVTYTVTLPDGRVLDNHKTSCDLSSVSAQQLAEITPLLACLPSLQIVRLGDERPDMNWEALEALHAQCPALRLDYGFSMYGKDFNLCDATVNLYCTPVEDEAAMLYRVMPLMCNLRYVDLDSCGMPAWQLEELNQAFPDVKVVFRVWFGKNYSVRTDTERILASMPSKGGEVLVDNYEGLFYCHDVKYLDVGHNFNLTDISFVAEMPNLEVAVLSMCNWTDASPLANCPHLEFLEMFNTLCTDLSPLSELHELRHLNVAAIGFDDPTHTDLLTDITPLYGLTDLERLWLGAYNPIPAEQVSEMQRRAPQCEINVEVYVDPSGGHWRYLAVPDYITLYVPVYHERYVLLRQQFGDYELSAFSFSWNDPLYPG